MTEETMNQTEQNPQEERKPSAELMLVSDAR
jgi:hypothetical protein